jgi:triosephosphate isomerase
VVVCPPFTALRSVQTVIEADYLRIRLGAQDVYWEEAGAFTGEVSPAMLAALRVAWVIVGHSERRQLLGDDDAAVARKLRAVLAAGMAPILAVGETLEQREEEITEDVIGSQLQAGLDGLAPEVVAGLAIAYEPIWAIGTGRTASDEQAADAIGYLREQVRRGWGDDAADGVRILYGGSVNPGNIAGLMAKRDIDGALVGGASLDPDSFAAIVRYWK